MKVVIAQYSRQSLRAFLISRRRLKTVFFSV
jgi:hypothetical protein